MAPAHPTAISHSDDRAWRRSFLVACALHAGLLVFMLRESGLLTPVDGASLAPIVSSEIVPAPSQSHPLENSELAAAPDDRAAIIEPAIEPDAEAMRAAASRLLVVQPVESSAESYGDLVKKARLLERISTPEEVQRMSSGIRSALGVEPFPVEGRGEASAASIDFDLAQLVSSRRVETPDRVEIHERLTDSRGATAEIIYVRRRGADGAYIYEQIYIEGRREGVVLDSSSDEFDEALARLRPFELMEKFPLLKKLHREAVLPLMDKIGREATPDTGAGTGG